MNQNSSDLDARAQAEQMVYEDICNRLKYWMEEADLTWFEVAGIVRYVDGWIYDNTPCGLEEVDDE